MTDADPAALKAAARAAAFARREAAQARHGPAPLAATEALLAALDRLAPAARVVAGYLPIRTEIDPRPSMAALVRAGLRVASPVVAGPGAPLVFREWTPDAPLIAGRFGAATPPLSAPELRPDALIVPLAAYDRAMTRLGYGGGYYDRTLAALRAEGSVAAVGFAYADQLSDAPLPVEPTDIALDAVATEAGLRRAEA